MATGFKTNNISINAVLNVIRQCLKIIFPLITFPYAIRILGVANIGKYSYSASIVGYLTLFAMLGVTPYSIREGSKIRNERLKLNIFVNEIFSINIISTLISYFVLAILVVFVKKFHAYSTLLFLQGLNIFFTTLSIDWINTIFEDFFLLTVRSLIINIISVVLLFILVRTPDDLAYYVLLSVFSHGFICFFNWFYCRRYVKIRFVSQLNLKKHIKPLLIFFANTITVSIYINIGVTILGWIKGDYDVGLYSMSAKIYNIAKTIFVAIYAVSIPKLSLYFGNSDFVSLKKLFTDLFCYLSLILLPASTGIICLSEEIVLLIGGEVYIKSAFCLRILGVALIFAIYGGLTTACLNITLGREKDNLLATAIGAGLNFVLNIIIIPFYSYNGSAFATVFSEAFVFLFCFVRIPEKRKYLSYSPIVKSLFNSFLGSGVIIFISYIIKTYGHFTLFTRIIFIIIASIVSYLTLLLVLKDSYTINTFTYLKNKMGNYHILSQTKK